MWLGDGFGRGFGLGAGTWPTDEMTFWVQTAGFGLPVAAMAVSATAAPAPINAGASRKRRAGRRAAADR
jgi:hypothetical protein